MKVVLIFFSVLISLSLCFPAQETRPVVCRGKPLPITLLPGPEMTGPTLPLRFGGTRQFPTLGLLSEARLVIKTPEEFSAFWKQLTAQMPPANAMPQPEGIDFSKEMIVVAAMGRRPMTGYWIVIDGACESDGQVEVFVTNVDDGKCGGFTVEIFPADVVRLPRTDLPVVFRETHVSCTQWRKQFRM